MQSRLMSIIEANTNAVVGFCLSWSLWCFVVGPLFGYDATPTHGFMITVLFTVTSILRSYTVRRFFNYLHGRAASR